MRIRARGRWSGWSTTLARPRDRDNPTPTRRRCCASRRITIRRWSRSTRRTPRAIRSRRPTGGSSRASRDRAVDVGLFGKLPSHGDFIRRRVSDQFIDAWDAWLRQCLSKSQAVLGDRWVDVYLTSPAWRFVAAARACGPSPVIGLIAPSVDRVGRFFPLTLVAELPDDVSLVAAANAAMPFFRAAERLVIDTLADEQVDFESFDQRVVELADELYAIAAAPPVVLDPNTA